MLGTIMNLEWKPYLKCLNWDLSRYRTPEMNYSVILDFHLGAFSNWWWCPPWPYFSLCVFSCLHWLLTCLAISFDQPWAEVAQAGPGHRSGHGRAVSSMCTGCFPLQSRCAGLCSQLGLLPRFLLICGDFFLGSAVWQCCNTLLWLRIRWAWWYTPDSSSPW